MTWDTRESMPQEAAVQSVCPYWHRQQDLATAATALFHLHIPPLLIRQHVFLLCLLQGNLGNGQCHRSM